MNLIAQNPYRVLGLLGNSSERELQKQIATIKRYAEVGKSKAFDYDFDFLGKVSRTANDVQRASSQIEQANNKLHYSLFWFVNKSHIDETALNHLKEGNLDKAIEIWDKTIKDGEISTKNFSSITNLSTLLLGLSIQNGKLDKEKFQKAIDLKGKLIHSVNFQDFVSLTTGNGFSVDNSKISSTFTEDILSLTKKYLDKDGGISNADLIKAFGSFPETTRKYLASKFIEGPQHNIESHIDNSVEKRKAEPENANKFGSALFAATRNDLSFLKSVLGLSNVQYQMLANKLANEILQCSIDYFNDAVENDYDDDPFTDAIKLVQLAASVGPTGHVKSRVQDSSNTLEELKYSDCHKAIQVLNAILDAYVKLEEENRFLSLFERKIIDTTKVKSVLNPILVDEIFEKVASSGKSSVINEFNEAFKQIVSHISSYKRNYNKFISFLPSSNPIKRNYLKAKLEKEIRSFERELSEVKKKVMYGADIKRMEAQLTEIKKWQLFRAQETRDRQIAEQTNKIKNLKAKGEKERKKEISKLEEKIILKSAELKKL